jgi:hypothetical protein
MAQRNKSEHPDGHADGVSDMEKIYCQLVLDIREFARQLNAIGVQVRQQWRGH